jgi:basic membrane lipoprotein Med (substrate-binding protein (PBP1-ABC) superfamily)
VIKLVQAGAFTAQDFGGFSYMGKGGAYLAPYGKFDQKLPAQVKDTIAKRQQEILDGNFRVDVNEAVPQSD